MKVLNKTNYKFIIIFVAVILAVLGLKVNDVYAVEYTDENMNEILELIPNEISVNVKEIEKEKAAQLIKEDVLKVFKNKNINVSNINIEVSTGCYTIQEKNKASIYWEYNRHNYNKTIKVNYNNSNKNNSNDEQKAKNLKLISPRYYEVNLDMIPIEDGTMAWTKQYDKFISIIGNYYNKQVNDNTIVIKAFSGAGGTDGAINYWTFEGGTYLEIYINDILYDVRKMGSEFTVPVINVPNNIKNEEIKEYIISTIKKYNESFVNDIEDITKGANVVSKSKSNPYEITIPDGYTIKNRLRDISSYIIVRKEEIKTTEVSNMDTKTNIKLNTTSDVVPTGTTLIANKVTSGNSYNVVVKALENDTSKFEMYDISLINNNTKVQPNGKVKVSIPVPTGFDTSKIVVYYVADDGTKTKLDATIKDGYVVFETDHFSNYVVAEELNVEASKNNNEKNVSNNTESTTEKENITNVEHKLDNTPKTGKINNISNITVIVSILSTIGLTIVKKF